VSFENRVRFEARLLIEHTEPESMSIPTEKEVKKWLSIIGKANGFQCKNEYEILMQEPWGILAKIDHVWLKRIPILDQDIPVVAFEITRSIGKLWNKKMMKGDLTNLRLSQASIGVLVVPVERWKQEPPHGYDLFVNRMDDYLVTLTKVAAPMRLELWDLDKVLSHAKLHLG